MFHYVALAIALLGVTVSNVSQRNCRKSLKVATKVLAFAFALACYRELGWIGLALSFLSPNITDLLA